MKFCRFVLLLLIFSASLAAVDTNKMEKTLDIKDLSPQLHHYLGIELHIQTWNLLEKKERNQQDNNRMLAFAKGSNYHWYKSPKWEPINEQRGFWLIARVYTVLERKEEALEFASKCLKISKEINATGFDLAGSYEVNARAYALNQDKESYLKYKKLAFEAAKKIEDEADRKYFKEDFYKFPLFDIEEK
ncbi:MAG: hypothetical protein U9N34_01755 [Candidatus Cloacimonadota bacterium]|nr:hypothetical protein [Candidatus Cloacimonadota bacterium]